MASYIGYSGNNCNTKTTKSKKIFGRDFLIKTKADHELKKILNTLYGICCGLSMLR